MPDADLGQVVQAIVTVLAVINPAVCGTIFLMLTAKLESPQKRRAAVEVALAILAILLATVLADGCPLQRRFSGLSRSNLMHWHMADPFLPARNGSGDWGAAAIVARPTWRARARDDDAL